MRIQIINTTGRGFDTRIVDADTGEDIQGVVGVEPIIVDEMVRVRITIAPDRIDLISEDIQWAMFCPYCGAELESYKRKDVRVRGKSWLDSIGDVEHGGI